MNIKLIIWDLDETFWKGTLSEDENVIILDEIFGLIRRLNEHGVVNSICSKSNYKQVRQKLKDLNIWDEFIMPVIELKPKGQLVKSIINNFQLRNENVLFIDDSFSNLEEVKFYNPKINVLNPNKENFKDYILNIIRLNKSDKRKRFGCYKILEKRIKVKENSSSNEDFLRMSNICMQIDYDCKKYLARIEELINRTNQLNFTQKRISSVQLKNLINNKLFKNFVVFVKDRYGDYGLIGFVSLNQNENKLEFFVFSCRVLNMGIEQYLFRKLGMPKLYGNKALITKLYSIKEIDWIQEKSSGFKLSEIKKNPKEIKRALIIGGCDLSQLMHYLEPKNYAIDAYFDYPSKKYNTPLHRDSINFIYSSMFFSDELKNKILENFPLSDKDFFTVPDFNNYGLIIYSPLIDYAQNNYIFKENKKIRISWSDFTLSDGSFLFENKKLANLGVEKQKIDKFTRKWISIGPISGKEFYDKLSRIFSNYKGKLIILNGAERNLKPEFFKYLSHHRQLNKKINEFVNKKSGAVLLDVNKFITSQDDFSDSIRHYKKNVYFRLAESIILQTKGFKKKPFLKQIYGKIKKWYF